MRGSQWSVPVLVAALLLAGCGTDSNAARRVVEKIDAPAGGWTPGGPRVDVFTDDVDLDDGVWVLGDYDQDTVADDDPSYLVSWEVAVKPGTEQQRCQEVAAWLRRSGGMLPGQKVDPGTRSPDDAGLVLTCVRLLNPLENGSGSDTGFGAWPGTEKHGYRYFAGAAAAANGSALSLSVNVLAAPAGNFGS